MPRGPFTVWGRAVLKKVAEKGEFHTLKSSKDIERKRMTSFYWELVWDVQLDVLELLGFETEGSAFVPLNSLGKKIALGRLAEAEFIPWVLGSQEGLEALISGSVEAVSIVLFPVSISMLSREPRITEFP